MLLAVALNPRRNGLDIRRCRKEVKQLRAGSLPSGGECWRGADPGAGQRAGGAQNALQLQGFNGPRAREAAGAKAAGAKAGGHMSRASGRCPGMLVD